MDVLRIFNLQLFAEDDFEDNQTDSDTVVDETVDDVNKTEDDEINIPEEFEGLDPEIAREFTNKFREQQKAEDEKLESKKDEQEEQQSKQDDEEKIEDKPTEGIEEQLAKLRKENEQLRKQQEQIPKQQEFRPAPFKPIKLEQVPIEFARTVISEAKKIALKSVNLTEEQLNDLEFEDNGAQKKADYEAAFEIAKDNIMSNVNSELALRNQRKEAFMQAHRENMAAFKAFENEQKKDTHFKEIQDFAINGYFEKQSVVNQNIIRDAYARLERGVASPSDRYTIESYFENAKREYYKDINAKQKEKQDKVVNKYKQAKKMPRADKLSGGGDTSGKSDVDIAIEMMNNRPWEKIPEKYQKILLGE